MKYVFLALLTLHTCNHFPPPVLALLYYFLFAVLVQSVPMSHPPPAFREAAERAKTLVEKILRDLPAVHAAAINTEVNTTSDWLAQLHSCSSFVSNLFSVLLRV